MKPQQPIICRGCKQKPKELEEYAHIAKELHMDADEVVRRYETTLNPETGLFLCTPCFVAQGMPGVGEWQP